MVAAQGIAGMTITLAPDPNPRRADRGPQAKRHVGPYYGDALRRVLAPSPEPSLIERVTEWYLSRRWPAAVLVGGGLVVAAIVFAAWIVS